MITLNLGVIDVPYANKPHETNAPRAKAPVRIRKDGMPYKQRARLHGPWQPGKHTESGEETTGEVAQFLENKYHVEEIFFEENQDKIAEWLAEHMADAIDTLVATGNPPEHLFPVEGIPEIQKAFNDFIDTKQMDGIQPGVPTAASLKGVNSRGKTLNPGRPSFRDTGNFEQSFRAWITTE